MCAVLGEIERECSNLKGSYTAVINVYFHDDITQTPFLFPFSCVAGPSVRYLGFFFFFFFSPLFKMTGLR